MLFLLALLACGGDEDTGDAAPDTSDIDDTPDTGDTGDDAPDTDTGDADTGDADTGDTSPPEPAPRFEGQRSLADADARRWGLTSGETAGWALADAGDVDGDGRAEVLVGAVKGGVGGVDAGAAYLIAGASFVDDGPLDEVSLLRFVGAAGDHAGSAVAWARDADGDGDGDVIVGAPGVYSFSPDPVAGAGPGFAYVIDADAGDAGPADALRIVGEADQDRAGWSVAGGDLDGDGADDLVVGAPQHADGGDHAGAAYWLAGPLTGDRLLADADQKWLGETSGGQAGAAALYAGDVDGDGYGDLLVSADGDELGPPGAVYLLRGPLGEGGALRGLEEADAVFEGEAPDDVAGSQIDAADADGDGHVDLLIDAYENDSAGNNAGAAYLIYGPVSGSLALADAPVKFEGVAGDQHGAEASCFAGDLDGDGHQEVLLGAHTHGDVYNDGQAYLFYGPFDALESMSAPDATFTAERSGDQAGWAVAGPGDVDGDGYDDAVISSRSAAGDALGQGIIYLFTAP